jgi:hypothetical protein
MMVYDVFESATRLIKAATGDKYGDGMTVTDIGKGIIESGYGDDDTVWVAGDWNTKRFVREGEPPLTNAESMPARLGTALERIGVEILWSDQWYRCDGCFKAFLTQGDSYSWAPYYLETDGERICVDCFKSGYETDEGIREFGFVDNPDNAVPEFITDSDLIEWGWEKYNGTYENGWHPGQDDNPRVIFSHIKADKPNVEVIFRLSERSQFYLRFEAWFKEISE